MDRQHLKTPFYGSRKMKAWLLQQGYLVSRKRVRRLMRLMGLEAIYRRPNTSKPAPGHRIFPYLLKGVEVNRVDQVWAARTSPTSPWRRASCTWWPSWTGTAGTCWPGSSPWASIDRLKNFAAALPSLVSMLFRTATIPMPRSVRAA